MEKPEKTKYETRYRKVSMKLSDGTLLNGRINIMPNQRLSDVFTRDQKVFVIIVDSDSTERSFKTVVVNKNEVVWVEPDDDL